MKTVEEIVALSMDGGGNVAIVPFLPYILQDFHELGSSARTILEAARRHAPAGKRLDVLDVGCGKGAISILLAAELDCRCLGLDAIHEFTVAARARAEREGVAGSCAFASGDARAIIPHLGSFDVIVLGSTGPILGGYFGTMTALKPHLLPDGIIILDDGYLDDGSPSDHELIVNRSTLLGEISRAGMALSAEMPAAPPDRDAEYDGQLADITRRCAELEAAHPDRTALFRAYAERQRQEYRNLKTDVICATLIIRHA